MTLLSREREEGEIYRQKRGVKYHASTITINSELQKWKKQKANRDQRREKLLTGKVLTSLAVCVVFWLSDHLSLIYLSSLLSYTFSYVSYAHTILLSHTPSPPLTPFPHTLSSTEGP